MENFEIFHKEWLWKDFELLNEVLNIHFDLINKNIKEGSDEYWYKLEIELYNRKKDHIMKYFTLH